MDNEILNYKDLAALPKIKAIYEVQRPDLISYEPYHRYTSDETLERYSYGEVLSRDVPRAGPPSGDMAWGGASLTSQGSLRAHRTGDFSRRLPSHQQALKSLSRVRWHGDVP